jgi:restriction system protein
MALWLFRAGRNGEYEKRFLNEGKVYLTWDNLSYDLSKPNTKKDLFELLKKVYHDSKMATVRNWTGQIWPVAHEMEEGDWIVLPSKLKPSAIHIGEITGPYIFNPKGPDPYYHYRAVKWIATDIPRSNFDQELLYSFGALQTICKIERKGAENRVRAMAKTGWKIEIGENIEHENEGIESENRDYERLARDEIAKLIIRKLKGHGLTRLVESILKTQGYITYRSPEGPDKGIDILAAPGPLGYGTPRICVQVKSGDTPVDSPTLNQLIGSMQNVQADQGLFVSWGGFKSSIDKEIPAQFFRVRLWDQDKLIDALLNNYDSLDPEIRADLPLKRIWTVADVEDED